MSSSMHKIEIDSLCKHHTLPFVYICITKYCQCQIRLCEKCHTQHEAENQNSNLMKLDNFMSKVATEVEIVNKQQDKLLTSSGKKPSMAVNQTKDKVQKFTVNQVKVLEDSMKYLNEESNKVNKQIQEASQVLTAKMNNVEIKRKELPETFCKRILDNKLIQTLITFYSQKGFSNFRKKLDKTLQFRAILKDFLTYADKFGTKYEQFMKSSSTTASNDLSMKSTMKDILKSRKNQSNEQNAGNLQFKKNAQRQNNIINDQQPRREKRAKTIFGK